MCKWQSYQFYLHGQSQVYLSGQSFSSTFGFNSVLNKFVVVVVVEVYNSFLILV